MTFAVIGKCPETGAIGVGMTTFSVNVGRVSPVVSGLLPTFQESGAIVLPHSYANRQLAYDTFRLLEQGSSLEQLKAELPKTDPYFSYRQYSVLTVAGDLWVHTGDKAFEYAGHIVEDQWAVSGNALASSKTVEGMAASMRESAGQPLSERIVRALEAGRDAGGQGDVRTGKHWGELSCAVFVADGKNPYPKVDLRVDYHPHAVSQLRRLYEYTQPLDHYYEGMQKHPDTFWDFIKERGVLDMPHFHADEVDIERG